MCVIIHANIKYAGYSVKERCKAMKNMKAIILIMIALAGAPLSGYSQSQASAGAAGGMAGGTAVAIGVVGAALLVALGDSSRSAPAAVSAASGGGSA